MVEACAALLQFCNACQYHACVPSCWKHGVAVPLPKGARTADRENYRPITLTSCFAKTLERMILNRIQPHVDPILDDSQAGFRWGANLQVYTFLETLQLRNGSRTFCAFLDIRKAFDVAWRDGALLRLHRAGVSGRPWHLIDDFVSDRTAAVRIAASVSEQWELC